MTTGKTRRLNKIETSLTPREAVQLWLKDALHYSGISEYCSVTSRLQLPRPRVARQLKESARHGTSGKPPVEAEEQMRRIVEEGDFLVMLALVVNDAVQESDRSSLLETCYVSKQAELLLLRDSVSNDMATIMRHLTLDHPYPVDVAAARAIDASVRDEVAVWEQVHDWAHEWTFEHFIEEGRRTVPWELARVVRQHVQLGNQRHGVDGEKCEELNPQTYRELLRLFGAREVLVQYISGEDFSYGFIDVTDVEFEEIQTKIETAARGLTAAGEVDIGYQVNLSSLPVSLLQEAPLVGGEWLDRFVIELAELATSLAKRGFRPEEPHDGHPLAHLGFCSDGDQPAGQENSGAGLQREADYDELQVVRRETRKRVSALKSRKIKGRPYVHLDDYRKWKGRECGDDLTVVEGVVVASWNAWVDAHGGDGEASVSGVTVGRVSLPSAAYEENEDEREAFNSQSHRRHALKAAHRWFFPKVDTTAGGHSQEEGHSDVDCFEASAVTLRERVLALAGRLILMQSAAETVAREYFAGGEVLFADNASSLTSQSEMLEATVAVYNEVIVHRLAVHCDLLSIGQDASENPGLSRWLIDIDVLREEMAEAVAAKVNELVTLAKSETARVYRERGSAENLLESLETRPPPVATLTGLKRQSAN
jgi:hypothetical protein